MVPLDKAVTARLNNHGLNFEILVDCEKAIELKQGKQIPLDEVVVTFDVFKDVKKGLHASENDLQKVFLTQEKSAIVKKIIKEGEVQLTQEYRNKLREEKKRMIINLIHRYSINPTNNLPHPLTRIEAALEEAKVKIDEFKSAD